MVGLDKDHQGFGVVSRKNIDVGRLVIDVEHHVADPREVVLRLVAKPAAPFPVEGDLERRG